MHSKLPWMAWNDSKIQRSFDAFQFLHVADQGIFWKGMHAAYLTQAPAEHVRAARSSRWRQIVFHGEIEELSLSTSRYIVDFAGSQGRLGKYHVLIPET